MSKKLKIWNGRGQGRIYGDGHIYVAAYSQKQAVELVSKACYGNEHPDLVSISELRTYYHADAWGNAMNGIIPTEACVYATKTPYNDVPVKIDVI
jgi:hypothetical protein